MMTHLVVNFAIQLTSKRTDIILLIVVLDLVVPFIPPPGRFKLKETGFLSLSMFFALLNEVIYKKIPSSVSVPVLVTLSRTLTIPFPFRSHISLRKRSMPILYIWVVIFSLLSPLMSTHISRRSYLIFHLDSNKQHFFSVHTSSQELQEKSFHFRPQKKVLRPA